MIKWFAYIVLVLIFAPYLLFAGAKNSLSDPVYSKIAPILHNKILADTILVKNAKQICQNNYDMFKYKCLYQILTSFDV